MDIKSSEALMTLFRLTHTAWSWLKAQGTFGTRYTVRATEKFLADAYRERVAESFGLSQCRLQI